MQTKVTLLFCVNTLCNMLKLFIIVPQAEKNRIKREIERYTSIMTTEVADNKQAADEKKKAKKNQSPNRDGDKAEKLREKIQQLLRKQWESRLQLVVDPKPQPQAPLER